MLSLRASVAKRGNLLSNIKTNSQIATPDKNFWGLTPATIHFSYFNLDSRLHGNDKMWFNKVFAHTKAYFILLNEGSIMSKKVMNKKAFTLIELLVVVLIIGVLAAIAIPQYLRAIEKANAMQAVTIGQAVKNAVERVYLIKGEYPDNLNELDIEYSCPQKFNCGYSKTAMTFTLTRKGENYFQILYGFDRRNEAPGSYVFTMSDQSKRKLSGLSYCAVGKDDKKGKELCAAIAGNAALYTVGDDYARYPLN
jgi:prepilin-type N-terminal cleavage/methylation domain-containing protein